MYFESSSQVSQTSLPQSDWSDCIVFESDCIALIAGLIVLIVGLIVLFVDCIVYVD